MQEERGWRLANRFGVKMNHAVFNKAVEEGSSMDGKCKQMIIECGNDTVLVEFDATNEVRTCTRNVKYVSKK